MANNECANKHCNTHNATTRHDDTTRHDNSHDHTSPHIHSTTRPTMHCKSGYGCACEHAHCNHQAATTTRRSNWRMRSQSVREYCFESQASTQSQHMPNVHNDVNAGMINTTTTSLTTTSSSSHNVRAPKPDIIPSGWSTPLGSSPEDLPGSGGQLHPSVNDGEGGPRTGSLEPA